MIIYCMKCASELDPFDNFCPFCGAEAPRRTILPDLNPRQISAGIYCPHCLHINLSEALFCASCGKHLYQLPPQTMMHCPVCGIKNKTTAGYCQACKLKFADWFSTKSELAKKLGYRGSFTLHETMTDLHYHFLTKEEVHLGRNEDNDIHLPSSWVTGRHCTLHRKKWQLLDKESTNGTFANRSAERISKMRLDDMHEFNIAGVFTFKVYASLKIFVCRLTAVLDEKEIKRMGHLTAINELRRHYFILAGGDGILTIRKMDGEVIGTGDDPLEFFTIEMRQGYYYFSDEDRELKQQILLKKYNNLPVSWKISFHED